MKGSLQQITLSELGDTVGTPAGAALVGSVRQYGVMQPVILAEAADGEGVIALRIIDGNRRVAAARSTGLAHIPAIVLADLDSSQLASITLILNGFRASNYLTEFWAIRQLEKLGFTDASIRSLSGLTASKLKQRTDLSKLDRDLFVALRNSQIFQTHAATISQMPRESQQALAQVFHRKGYLSQRDLDSYKVQKQRRVETSPEPTVAPVIAWMPVESQDIPADSFNQSQPIPKLHTPLPPIQDVPSRIEAQAPQGSVSTHIHRPDMFLDRLNSLLRNAAVAARDDDYTREEFLELAALRWDQVNGRDDSASHSSHEAHVMSEHIHTEKFPDLAAHKWDTGES